LGVRTRNLSRFLPQSDKDFERKRESPCGNSCVPPGELSKLQSVMCRSDP